MIQTIKKIIENESEFLSLQEFERLSSLGESRYIDRKSIRLLENASSNKDKIKKNLGKEVSAFSNFEGGILLLGVNDSGDIEDGVENTLGNGSMKEWLEDVVYFSTTPFISNYSVKLVEKSNLFLFVIAIGKSNMAPHQCATNNVYYGRIDGQARPLDGSMVHDIYSREEKAVIVPVLEIERVNIQNNPNFAKFTFGIKNISNVCAESNLAVINIISPQNIMNGGYHRGKNTFSGNKAQLYSDILYPDINLVYDPVYFREFQEMEIEVMLVARNFRKKEFTYKITYQNETFNIASL